MKQLYLIIFLLFAFSLEVSSLDIYDVQDVATSDSKLIASTANIDNVLSTIPKTIMGFIFENDEQVHVRIDTDEFAVEFHKFRITGIYTGRATNPTKYFDTSRDTIISISKSDHPGLLSIYYYLTGQITVTEANFCTSDLQCDENEVCTNRGCLRSFTILVVPLGYSSNDAFLDDVMPQIDKLSKVLPIDETTTRLRFHYVNTSICSEMYCSDYCGDCQTKALECADDSGLIGFTDRIVAFADTGQDDLCGCTTSNSFVGVSKSPRTDNCREAFPYIFGQQLGLCGLNRYGILCPNSDDIDDPGFATDIMNSIGSGDHYGPIARKYLVEEKLVDIH